MIQKGKDEGNTKSEKKLNKKNQIYNFIQLIPGI